MCVGVVYDLGEHNNNKFFSRSVLIFENISFYDQCVTTRHIFSMHVCKIGTIEICMYENICILVRSTYYVRVQHFIDIK